MKVFKDIVSLKKVRLFQRKYQIPIAGPQDNI